jgi:hypothetical protein
MRHTLQACSAQRNPTQLGGGQGKARQGKARQRIDHGSNNGGVRFHFTAFCPQCKQAGPEEYTNEYVAVSHVL